MDLSTYVDQQVVVKFIGGRQVTGVLTGFDQVMNLVLEQTVETLRDEDDLLTDKTRELGKVVIRGVQVLTIAPLEGLEEISNPFIEGDSVSL